MINLKEIKTDELENMLIDIKRELDCRQDERKLVLYTHNCFDSSKNHIIKHKHWSKLVTSVDTTKTNGYAFIGDFLSVTSEHKILSGSIVVEVCDVTITCYRIEPEGKTQLFSGHTKRMSEFIDNVAGLF